MSNKIEFHKLGVEFTLPTPSDNSGLKFKGWYDNIMYEGTAITKITMNEPKVLYGKWGKDVVNDSCTITLGSSTWEKFDSQYYLYKLNITIPSNFPFDLYSIDFSLYGYRNGNTTELYSVTIDENVTVLDDGRYTIVDYKDYVILFKEVSIEPKNPSNDPYKFIIKDRNSSSNILPSSLILTWESK